MAAAFTLVFLFILCLSFCLRAWLAARHFRHVRARRNAVPAEFAASITLDAHQHAADYTCAKIRLAALSYCVDAVLLLALTIGGGFQALWNLSAQAFTQPIAHGTAFLAFFAIVTSLVSLPLTLISTFAIEARFGFNQTTLALFIRDGIKSAVVGALIGLPLTALVLWLMRASGPLWWLWVWAVWTGFSLLMVVLYPIWIAPLFNRFSPLEDESLRARIVALLERTGFKSQGVFVMDGSRRSSHGNAYFTGFGAAKRIVFFDTLITRLTHPEIEAVLAHELGHFKKKHVAKRIAMTFALSLAALAILGQLIQQPWFYQGLGLESQSPALALALFFSVAPLFAFPLTPLSSLLSRRHEFEADDFAASETRADDLITALVKLYRDNASTLTPDPLYSAFYDSHPPASIRIAHLKGERQ